MKGVVSSLNTELSCTTAVSKDNKARVIVLHVWQRLMSDCLPPEVGQVIREDYIVTENPNQQVVVSSTLSVPMKCSDRVFKLKLLGLSGYKTPE